MQRTTTVERTRRGARSRLRQRRRRDEDHVLDDDTRRNNGSASTTTARPTTFKRTAALNCTTSTTKTTTTTCHTQSTALTAMRMATPTAVALSSTTWRPKGDGCDHDCSDDDYNTDDAEQLGGGERHHKPIRISLSLHTSLSRSLSLLDLYLSRSLSPYISLALSPSLYPSSRSISLSLVLKLSIYLYITLAIYHDPSLIARYLSIYISIPLFLNRSYSRSLITNEDDEDEHG